MITVSSNAVGFFEGTAFPFLLGPQVAQHSMWPVIKVTSDR